MAMHTILAVMAQLIDHFSTCLFFSSAALSRALTRVAEEQFAACDLSVTQGYILIALSKAPGITASDLAAVLFLDQSTVTKTIDRMVMKGLVQREPVGRSVRVFPTGKGDMKGEEAKAAWMKSRQVYMKAIGEPTAKLLATELAKAREKVAPIATQAEDAP